ncbi:BofC C-terminal domain-containing protein [Halonatronum saccharophilum]|uniref:BofC C-terminal domain-containing protein n=1 Tax=Halonatronum saccharophilum TaxID=150060 RepID=UPI000480B100|nr:BofC C-terminal domain-containing protein [Halonatronum saccharophilum]
MKGSNKLILIPLFMGVIAGLTYLAMDSFLGFDLGEEKDYNSEILEFREKESLDQELDQKGSSIKSLNIVDIIKREEKRLNDKIKSIPDISLDGGFVLDWFSENKELKEDNPFLDMNSKEVEEKLREGKDEGLDNDKIIEFGKDEYVGEGNFYHNKAKKAEEEKSGEGLMTLESDKDEREVKVNKAFFLGIKDGYIAIYRGEILGEKELIELREDIPVDELSERDKENLMKGIEVEDREELLSMLEGFVSAIEE